MTSISRSFADGAAMLLFMNSRKPANSQSEVDKIVELVRASTRENPTTADIYAPFDGASIDTTDGNESDDPNLTIDAFHDARISTGGGNDEIGTYDRAIIASGGGDDLISTYDYGDVSSGAGNDVIHGNSYMRVDAGDGDDEVRTYGYAAVDAGDGNDLVVTHGYSQVEAGAGDDTLIALDRSGDDLNQVGHAVLRGGAGNDDIQIGRNSVANGGTGDDTITLIREGSTVEFARGDGHDKIFAADDFALALSGYSRNDVTLSKQDGNLIIAFAGSDDTITVNLPDERTINLSFDDGTEMTANGADESFAPKFAVKSTASDWRNANPYFEATYTGVEVGYTFREEYETRR